MKKTLAILLAVAVVFCAVGQAAAAGFTFDFDNAPLMLTTYKMDGTGSELNVDLGTLQTTDFGAADLTLAATGVVNFASIGAFADLSLGIYGTDFWGDHNMLATTQTSAPSIRISNLTPFNSGASDRAIAAGNKAVGNVATMEQSAIMSYANIMGTSGRMGGFNQDAADAAPSLAALASVGFIDMYLYDFNATGNLITGDGTDYVGVLRINADGSVIANPTASAVPIPGALVLFASGIVGLVGIRRKSA